MIILYLIRPIWTSGMAPIYHNFPIFCHIHTRLGSCCYVLSIFMPTLFNFFKIEFYFEVFGTTRNSKMEISIVWSLTIILFFFLCLGVVRSKSAPFIEKNTLLCFKLPDFWITASISFLWLIVNGYTMLVSFRNWSESHPLYPTLEPQMKVNAYVVPGLCLSTAFARLFPILVDYGNFGDMGFRTFTKTMPAVLDHLLNSCVMYWFLFGNAEIHFMQEETPSNNGKEYIADSRSRSRSWTRSPEQVQWISFTGAHPVKLDEKYIYENNLQSLIIPQHMQRKQKQLYHHRHFWESYSSADYELSTSRNSISNNLQYSGDNVEMFQPHYDLTE